MIFLIAVATAAGPYSFSVSEFNIMYHFNDLHEQFRYLRSHSLEFDTRVKNTVQTVKDNKADVVCNVEWFGHFTQQYYLGRREELYPLFEARVKELSEALGKTPEIVELGKKNQDSLVSAIAELKKKTPADPARGPEPGDLQPFLDAVKPVLRQIRQARRPEDPKWEWETRLEELRDRLLGLILSEELYVYKNDFVFDYFKRKEGHVMDLGSWKLAKDYPKKNPAANGFAFSVMLGYNTGVFEEVPEAQYFDGCKDTVPADGCPSSGQSKFHAFITEAGENSPDGPSFVVKQLRLKANKDLKFDFICTHMKSKHDGLDNRSKILPYITAYVNYRKKADGGKVNFVVMGDMNTEIAELAFDLGTSIVRLDQMTASPSAGTSPKTVYTPVSYGKGLERREAQQKVQEELAKAFNANGDKGLQKNAEILKKAGEKMKAFKTSFKDGFLKRSDKTKDFWVELANFDTQTKIRVGEIDFMNAEYQAHVKALIEHNPALKSHMAAHVAQWAKMIKAARVKMPVVAAYNTARIDLRNQTEVEFGAIADYLLKPIEKDETKEIKFKEAKAAHDQFVAQKKGLKDGAAIKKFYTIDDKNSELHLFALQQILVSPSKIDFVLLNAHHRFELVQAKTIADFSHHLFHGIPNRHVATDHFPTHVTLNFYDDQFSPDDYVKSLPVADDFQSSYDLAFTSVTKDSKIVPFTEVASLDKRRAMVSV